jgi:hypothetical protein
LQEVILELCLLLLNVEVSFLDDFCVEFPEEGIIDIGLYRALKIIEIEVTVDKSETEGLLIHPLLNLWVTCTTLVCGRVLAFHNSKLYVLESLWVEVPLQAVVIILETHVTWQPILNNLFLIVEVEVLSSTGSEGHVIPSSVSDEVAVRVFLVCVEVVNIAYLVPPILLREWFSKAERKVEPIVTWRELTLSVKVHLERSLTDLGIWPCEQYEASIYTES